MRKSRLKYALSSGEVCSKNIKSAAALSDYINDEEITSIFFVLYKLTFSNWMQICDYVIF